MSLWSVAGNVFIICVIAIMVLFAVLACTYIVLAIKDAVDSYSRYKKTNENDEELCLKK
ncbi:hypothetical protein [Bacillus wiedmannii]|uniref:hypothetical protein n=1 Tax=Bacillus wiedmannii TaxID=1890302 RepID=UPI0020CEA4C5|nr:hypothetical protein [Bacillus wiedmannii]MCP9282344.1 hypothetical protein [Bacillus wiedmannii]